MFDIEKFLDLSGYELARNNRRKYAGGTAEFFTPYSIVKRMCDKVSGAFLCNMDNNEILKKNGDRKWDICLMNPPYNNTTNGGLYLQFIYKVLDISIKSVIISPDGAFIQKRGKARRLKEKINKYKPEIEITKWENFDIAANSRCCISFWDEENPNEKIKVNGKEFEEADDIVLSNNKYLEEFYEKLIRYFENHDSIYDKCVANPRNNNYFDKTGKAKVVETWNDKDTWFTVFPYCVATYFTTFEYKKYSDDLWFGPARILVPFKTEEYAKNCFETVHLKNGRRGDLNKFYKMIDKLCERGYKMKHKYMYFPYLDFSRTYSNKELFEMIGMEYNEKEIDKILNEK